MICWNAIKQSSFNLKYTAPSCSDWHCWEWPTCRSKSCHRVSNKLCPLCCNPQPGKKSSWGTCLNIASQSRWLRLRNLQGCVHQSWPIRSLQNINGMNTILRDHIEYSTGRRSCTSPCSSRCNWSDGSCSNRTCSCDSCTKIWCVIKFELHVDLFD